MLSLLVFSEDITRGTHVSEVSKKAEMDSMSDIIVRELMGRVRNVVLIKCTSDLGKPKRGGDFGREGTWAG